MKKRLTALLVVAVMAPALSYAQSDAPVTRSEVRAQIAQAERDGDLHQSKVHYPEMHRENAAHDNRAYGADVEGKAQSGRITQAPPQAWGPSLYNHH